MIAAKKIVVFEGIVSMFIHFPSHKDNKIIEKFRKLCFCPRLNVDGDNNFLTVAEGLWLEIGI